MIEYTITDTQYCVVGNGIESGSWTWDGVDYDNRILIWDPNFPAAQTW